MGGGLVRMTEGKSQSIKCLSDLFFSFFSSTPSQQHSPHPLAPFEASLSTQLSKQTLLHLQFHALGAFFFFFTSAPDNWYRSVLGQ